MLRIAPPGPPHQRRLVSASQELNDDDGLNLDHEIGSGETGEPLL